MSKPKRHVKAKAKVKSKTQRRRRYERKLADTAVVTGIGDPVHRGKGKRRQLGRIVGWSFDGKRRLTWIIGER